jgi:hypothetical protein
VPPATLGADEAVFDFRSDAARIARAHGAAWRDAFVDWLGGLNRANASLSWWAYTSTAKNLLSSPLGDACLGMLALEEFLAGTAAARVHVVGAAPAHIAAMRERVHPAHWQATAAGVRLPALEPLVRLGWQFARMLVLWFAGNIRAPRGDAPQAMIFTYVDGAFREGPDAFFGDLAQRLPVRARYVAFVHSGYRAALPRLAASGYEPLFGSLRLADLLWSFKASVCAWWRAARRDGGTLGGKPAGALLAHALRWDLGRGGYFYNLLVHRAALRLLARWQPQWLLYPFEGKSLEKMLLLAARTASPRTRIIGYQHTSITPRHATLIFAPGEAAATPLPERVVAVGEVTRRYLEAEGRYPAGFLVTGCALRQRGGTPLERRSGEGKPRLLLALSSSRQELVEAVALCRSAVEHGGVELAIRPHPEFPLALLPGELRAWTHGSARDVFGTALSDNLQWCDAVVYASSTVALEALGRGRPVINLRLADLIDADPVLNPLDFHWQADTPAMLAAAANDIVALDSAEFDRRRRQALAYVDEYLRAPSPAALAAFLPP